jgi:plasmid stability protein
MAMTLRLDEKTHEALRQRAAREGRSMQETVRDAVDEYLMRHAQRDELDRVLDEQLPRYEDALRRLGQ